jgi:pentatricopeptide repeat protein
VKPNSSAEQTLPVYNAVLHGLLDHANAETAFSIFQRMQDEGPKPDLVSYNTVLTYHGRQGNFKAMAAVVTQMASAGVPGDVFTYSTILSALLKAGRADAPEMVINIMRKQGVKASVATYSAIINSQMREQTVQHLQAAMHLLHEMEMDPDVAPNEITYTSILAGLYRGEWLSADQIEMYKQDIIARMKKRKISFKTQGYNILIKACLTSEDPKGLEDGLGFYKEMDRRKIPRSDDTWYIMLAGLIDRGAWQLADDVVREMLSSGAQPGNSVSRLVKKVRNHSRV